MPVMSCLVHIKVLLYEPVYAKILSYRKLSQTVANNIDGNEIRLSNEAQAHRFCVLTDPKHSLLNVT